MVAVAKYTSPMDTMGVEDLDSVCEKKSQHHQIITAMKLEDLSILVWVRQRGGYGDPSVGRITGLLCPFYGSR